MNFEGLLFNNKFVKKVDIKDLPLKKKEEFRSYYEKQVEQQKRKEFLEKQSTVVSNTVSSDFSNISNRDIYTDLAKFNPNFSTLQEGFPDTRKTIKIEKKTVVSIDSRNRDINKYPDQNDFTIFLGKTFYNVKKIELVSSEFPNTDQVIKDKPVQLQNNIITWQNEDDIDLNFVSDLLIDTVVADHVDITFEGHGITVGTTIEATLFNSKYDTDIIVTGFLDAKRELEVIDENTLRFPYKGGIANQGTTSLNLGYPDYSVTFKPGNYTATTLASQIASDMGFVKRDNGTGQFHYFEVLVNLDTDVMTLDSVKATQLQLNPLSTIAGSTTITVNQNGHGFKTGERVKMIGVKNTAGITSSDLNGDFSVNVLDFNTFTYEVITRASETVDGGGNTVMTGKDTPFRLLFDTSNTLIQFNTGFPDENSSEYIGVEDPITTKALNVSDVSIISPTKLRFTTIGDHGLSAVNIYTISSIAFGQNPEVTVTTPHGITVSQRVTLRGTDTYPVLNGTYLAVPTGVYTFTLKGIFITTPGTTGEILYGDDKIKVYNLRTVPSILIEPVFFVENIPASDQFDITFRASSVDLENLEDVIIGTSQIIINHPSHGFNQLSSITSIGGTFANIKTFLPHEYSGDRTDTVSIIDGPVSTNTVDVLLVNHGLVTSDEIIILNSTTDPDVNGTYKVQVVDIDTLRINFVHAVFIDGTATVLTGDKITITDTTSLPRIDGTYNIHNREILTSITTGTITVNITTAAVHYWDVGDIISLVHTDCSPNIDGDHTVQSIISPTEVEIDVSFSVTGSGTTGDAINKSRFKIDAGVVIDTPGINPAGSLGRISDVSHYRITGETEGIDNIANIPLVSLNKRGKQIANLIDVDNYMVRVSEEYSNKSVTSGGTNVRVSSLIHGFRSIQANTDTGEKTGVLYRSISLEGENYVYLTSQSEGVQLDTVLNSSNISNTFAKIILSESPGTLMFNTFISEPKVFDNPIAKIDKMRFRVVTPQGYDFNFNDINYSFTLRITELVDQLETAFISSRTGTTEFGNFAGEMGGSGSKAGKDSGKSGQLSEGAYGNQTIRAGAARGSGVSGGGR